MSAVVGAPNGSGEAFSTEALPTALTLTARQSSLLDCSTAPATV
jgi:hypothetical protein